MVVWSFQFVGVDLNPECRNSETSPGINSVRGSRLLKRAPLLAEQNYIETDNSLVIFVGTTMMQESLVDISVALYSAGGSYTAS